MRDRTRKVNILKIKEVMARVGLSRASIYNKIPHGFPKPIKLGPGIAAGWLDYEIDEWIEERIRERDASKNGGVT